MKSYIYSFIIVKRWKKVKYGKMYAVDLEQKLIMRTKY